MILRKLKVTVLYLLIAAPGALAADNVAYKDDNVRFTVVTDGLVRLEYAPDGNFVDNKSFVAVNRDYPNVEYTVKNGKWIEITTGRLTLRYKKGSGKFNEENLKISGKKDVFPFSWTPGTPQKENLKGTARTLDRCDGSFFGPGQESTPLLIEDGLLARDGWTLIDDSDNFIFDGAEDWDWVKERKQASDAQDWYFIAYGTDYKKALSDFAVLSGKMPLPPRFVFGYWWSRYFTYSDHEFRKLIDRMDSYQIPMDVLVVDMDWHYIDNVRGGWTGFSWNKALFPDPDRFLNYLRDKNLKITLNLHPADGILTFEDKYSEIANDMGINPGDKKNIPWYGSDKKFVKSVFKHILTPMEKEGVDFWWLDWQQYLNDLTIPNLSNTWWINYTFFSQMEKFTDRRPLLYHRWGGLGNHRYQIGFSGDTYVTWESLDFQPYFTHTASNVLYGFWSHDIGGHMLDYLGYLGDKALDRIDPEMYIRWMQFGAFSPVLRTHSTKDFRMDKEPWAFDPDITEMLRDIIQERYRMAPYIYTFARVAHDTSVSLCRPMYYDYPEAEEAYDFKNQYMFGNDMMIAPVTSPMTGNFSAVDVWLPEGKWYEMSSGSLLDGGKVVKRTFALDEYPVYVKAGAVLPFAGEKVKNLSANDDAVEITVFPGGNGSFSMYEDAGDSKNYETECAWTGITSTRDGHTLAVNIAPRQGEYAGMPSARDFSIRVMCSDVPESVTVNGLPAEYRYDAEEFAIVVNMPARDCAKSAEIKIEWNDNEKNLADGLIGRTSRCVKAITDYKAKVNGNRVFNDDLYSLGSVYVAVNYNPEKLHEIVNNFEKVYSNLSEVIKQFGDSDEDKTEAAWLLNKIGK